MPVLVLATSLSMVKNRIQIHRRRPSIHSLPSSITVRGMPYNSTRDFVMRMGDFRPMGITAEAPAARMVFALRRRHHRHLPLPLSRSAVIQRYRCPHWQSSASNAEPRDCRGSRTPQSKMEIVGLPCVVLLVERSALRRLPSWNRG